MAQVLTARSYAKINLTRCVLDRRPDGYHEIESIFQAVDLFDQLRFEQAVLDGSLSGQETGILVRCNHPQVPKDKGNLCFQAAQLLQERAGAKRAVEIEIEKAIPPGAGLGGGSSNAAATLLALDKLWDLGLGDDDLNSVASELGADVPFFLKGGTALARGKGEELSPIPKPKSFWLVLVKPEFDISTAWAYAEMDRRREGKGHQGLKGSASEVSRAMLDALQAGQPKCIAQSLHNDFEDALLPAFPDFGRIKESLVEAGSLGALVSGSGSVVVGLAENQDQAKRIATDLQGQWPWVKIAQTIDHGVITKRGEGKDGHATRMGG